MPLSKSCSLEALRENIAELISSGRHPDQAYAIAHKTLDEACGSTRAAELAHEHELVRDLA